MKLEKIKIVAQREYLKMVKSKAFWISTLMIPALMVVISLISGFSGESLEKKLKDDAANASGMIVLDESGLLNPAVLAQIPNLSLVDNYETGVEKIRLEQAEVLFYYPKDITTTGKIGIVSQDKGIFSLGMYDEVAKNLLKQNVLAGLNDPTKIAIFNAQFTVESRLFNKGAEVAADFGRFLIPVGSVFLYFLFSSLASGYLLMSVSEEKENRMIEIVLSVIKPRDLIIGKVLGLTAAIFTQLIVLIGMAALALNASKLVLPFDLSNVQIDPSQLVLAFIYLILGFLSLAFTMIGVGAAMPTYREANSFSAVFIMLSVFPLYFFALILADPSGPLSVGLSYFPYTAPLILMLRNALGVLPPLEIVLSIVVLLVYIVIIAVISFRMFEFGAMEYNQKVSFTDFFKQKFGKKKAV